MFDPEFETELHLLQVALYCLYVSNKEVALGSFGFYTE